MTVNKVVMIGLLAAVSSNSFAFKYHDNQIEFDSKIADITDKSQFKLTDFYIRSKQDPKGKFNNGHHYTFHQGTHFTFTAGRHGDKSTAEWFSRRFGGKKNTFHDNPGKLNFAVKGDLTLQLKDFTSSHKNLSKGTYTFKNIALAQGHADFRNNWWFGGSDCLHVAPPSYDQLPTVKCKGVDPKGNKIWGYFLSGYKPGVNFFKSIQGTLAGLATGDTKYLNKSINAIGDKVNKIELFAISNR